MKSVLLIDIRSGDEGYHQLVQESIVILDKEGIHHSKVSVNHILEAPIALRFAVETFRSMNESKVRNPNGYLVFGFIPKSEVFESVVYEEVLRSLQDMACYYGLALSHHTLFETKETEKEVGDLAQRMVFSCLNLIQMKKQFGLQTNHISTP